MPRLHTINIAHAFVKPITMLNRRGIKFTRDALWPPEVNRIITPITPATAKALLRMANI
jgi:hypothetical protein